ncbi:carboxypeptidase regulatory-like domain-containing protein, partial [Agromyces sp. NPDC058104]
GATASTFKLTSAQAGKAITVAVKGALSGYATVSKTSAATAKVATTATPTISGTVKVGSTLTAKPGTWTTGTTFTYQWYAAGTAITGATGSTFTPTTTHKGKTITVKVTGALSGYPTIAKTSAATVPVA